MTDVVGIVVRYALYLDLMLVFGLPAFAVYCRGGGAVQGRVLVLLAVAGLGLSLAGLVVLAATMGGTTIAAVDWPTIKLVSATAAGAAWRLRVEALAALVAIGLFGGGGIARLAAVGFGAVALSTLAATGHGAMDGGGIGIVHLSADIAHLLAAGVWVGALVALLVLEHRARRTRGAADLHRLHGALAGFAGVGTGVVGVIVVSGLVNAWLLVGPGNLGSLATTLYGRLLVAKLLLFAAMLGLALLNRVRLAPGLGRSLAAGDPVRPADALRRSLAAETMCAVAVLGLVAWLGTLAPPVSGP